MTECVFIPTAGIGSRLGSLTRYLNKSLISVNNKPLISHQIEKFSLDTEFIIALGYKGDLVRQFISLTYPNINIKYIEVEKYIGKDSGLGHTLKICEPFLQKPFIFLSCDTLVKEIVPKADKNWLGYANSKDLSQYRTIELGEYENIVSLYSKGSSNSNHYAYIGLCGIYDHQLFWSYMNSNDPIIVEEGESYAINKMINELDFKGHSFCWDDIGTPDNLKIARENYSTKDQPIILEKENEAIWFVKEKVIKFSDDIEFIKNRVLRSKRLNGFIPKVISSSKNMYIYIKSDGCLMSNINDKSKFIDLLNFSHTFWERADFSKSELSSFYKRCDNFYHAKTLKRVEEFNKLIGIKDSICYINGSYTPKLSDLFSMIDWEELSKGIPVLFHGDFHFENILYDSLKKKFTFLDWRQDFGGDIYYGDIYYDLAKLLHGLIINHQIIDCGFYSIDWVENDIKYDFYRKNILCEYESIFCDWLSSKSLDKKKVYLLTSIIFLNIAPLHHLPYNKLLYALGKSMLYDCLHTP